MIEINTWINDFLKALNQTFGKRVYEIKFILKFSPTEQSGLVQSVGIFAEPTQRNSK